jgi:hypothetical protein
LNDWEEKITPCDICRNTRDLDLMLLLIFRTRKSRHRDSEIVSASLPHWFDDFQMEKSATLLRRWSKFSIMPSLVFPSMTLVRICREMGGLVAETLSKAITHFEGEPPVHISTWA